MHSAVDYAFIILHRDPSHIGYTILWNTLEPNVYELAAGWESLFYFGRKTQIIIGAPVVSGQWLSVLTVSPDHTHSASLLPVHVGLVSQLVAELHRNQPSPSLKLWPRINMRWYFLNAQFSCTIVPLSYTSVYFSPTWMWVPEHALWYHWFVNPTPFNSKHFFLDYPFKSTPDYSPSRCCRALEM